MQFQLRSDRPLDILPDGTVFANVLWFEDDANPDHDPPFLIDQVRLPYWFLYRDDANAQRAYLLSVLRQRAQEIERDRQRARLIENAVAAPVMRDLCRGVHRITPDGRVIVKRVREQEEVIDPGEPDALLGNPARPAT